jgi:RimJ/RimL family protein N-acetyltransferase
MRHARDVLQIGRILAITKPDNEPSGKLLGKIGLRIERLIRLSDEADEVKLFSTEDKLEAA